MLHLYFDQNEQRKDVSPTLGAPWTLNMRAFDPLSGLKEEGPRGSDEVLGRACVSLTLSINSSPFWKGIKAKMYGPWLISPQGCGITRVLSNHFCDTRESPPVYGVLVFGKPFCCITEVVISHNPVSQFLPWVPPKFLLNQR